MLVKVRNLCFGGLLAVCLACGGSSTPGTGTAAIHGQLVVEGLDQPILYLADPTDASRAYVLERPGRVRLISNDTLVSNNVLDITGTVVTDGECGALGMAFDPNYASNHYVYLHYNAGSPIETRIVRYTMSVSGTILSNPMPVLAIPQPVGRTNHKGGAINFGSDGMLYFMTGDGGSGNDPDNNAQSGSSLLGKILRVDVTGDDFPSDLAQNYAIPSDNPFLSNTAVRGEIWAFGLRNPFRWTVDAVTGGFLIADVGQDAYEEVNYEPAGQGGRNYGWSLKEGLHTTSNPGPAFSTPFKDPFFEYDHGFGTSITGGFVYRGSGLDASFQNRYFFGDFVSGKIASVPFSLSGSEAVSTSLSSSVNHTSAINSTLGGNAVNNPVSITPDANGEIIVVDLVRGTVVRLVP